jgi:hypothetical protein
MMITVEYTDLAGGWRAATVGSSQPGIAAALPEGDGGDGGHGAYGDAHAGEQRPQAVAREGLSTEGPAAKSLSPQVGFEPTTSSKKRLVGSFSIIPLKRKAARLLDVEGLTVHTLRPEQIVRPHGTPSAIYVGGVLATTRQAKAASLAALQERCRFYRRRGIPMYARTATPDGLRLVRLHGFRAIVSAADGELGHIFRLEADEPRGSRHRGKRLSGQHK